MQVETDEPKLIESVRRSEQVRLARPALRGPRGQRPGSTCALRRWAETSTAAWRRATITAPLIRVRSSPVADGFMIRRLTESQKGEYCESPE